MGLLPYIFGDIQAINHSYGFATLIEPLVPINAKQNKRREDQDDQQNLHDLFMGTNEIKHGSTR
jgi:hypothetical protein